MNIDIFNSLNYVSIDKTDRNGPLVLVCICLASNKSNTWIVGEHISFKIWKPVFLAVLLKTQHVCLAREANAGNRSFCGPPLYQKGRGTGCRILLFTTCNRKPSFWRAFLWKRKKRNHNNNNRRRSSGPTVLAFCHPRQRKLMPLTSISMQMVGCKATIMLQGR